MRNFKQPLKMMIISTPYTRPLVHTSLRAPEGEAIQNIGMLDWPSAFLLAARHSAPYCSHALAGRPLNDGTVSSQSGASGGVRGYCVVGTPPPGVAPDCMGQRTKAPAPCRTQRYGRAWSAAALTINY